MEPQPPLPLIDYIIWGLAIGLYLAMAAAPWAVRWLEGQR